MNYTLNEYLKILYPHISPEIISEEYLACIKRIAGHLPLLSFGAFECFFGKGQKRVDFNISINSMANEHKLIGRWLHKYSTPGNKSFMANFPDVEKFFLSWAEDSFQLKPFINDFWLVYDIVDPACDGISPWYYIRFTPAPLNNDPSFKTEIIFRTLFFLNEPFEGYLEQAFRSFFNGLSPLLQVSAIGLQKRRGNNFLRVYLVTHKVEEIYKLLIKCKWPGDVNDLRRQVEELAVRCDVYGFGIDIDPGVQSRIGIEFWFNAEDPNKILLSLSGKLVAAGVCTPVQQQLFCEWEGQLEINNKPNMWSWPDSYQNSTSSTPEKVIIKKTARTIKIIYETGKPLKAKGYFGFSRPVFNN